ncbi:Cilia- and flagella-associated protein 43 [Oopsacas minuta]|uniref:Cilia- and flagella-associated protein 43 n=1 Tax=Oopsacas minuta TaxID=111878 RepID=A0AAV7KJJ2_9METZ|nr:Cilia- and flagella-associated protein 43 [Oopsacas minuta]
MEGNYGKLELSWQSGPLPTHNTQLSYLTDESILYNAGINLNLLDVSTGTTNQFGISTRTVSCIAVYRCNQWVAQAQLSVDSDVILLNERGDVKGKFETGARLEYSALAFSHDGKYIAGASGVPEFKLYIWDISNYKLVCSTEIGPDKRVKEIEFDPQNNSRLSAITDEGDFFLYKIEKCGSLLSELSRIEIELPDKDCRIGYEKDPITSQLSRPDVDATLHNPLLSDLEFYPYKVDPSLLESAGKSNVIAQGWGLNSQLYLLTTEAIFSIDGDKGKLTILYRLSEPSYIPPHTAQSHRDSQRVAFPEKEDDLIEQTDMISVSDRLLTNPLCMAITSQGFVLGYDDGMIRILDDKNQFVVKGEINLDGIPVCFIFPPSFTSLTVVTDSGGLYSLDILPQREPVAHKLNTVNRQPSLSNISTVALSQDREVVITANADGVILAWEGIDGQLISSIVTEDGCTTFVGLKSAPVVVTGTSSGYVCVFDLTEPVKPKLIQTKRLHKDCITELSTDIYSQVIISCSSDCNMFIMDARVSSDLNILCSLSLHYTEPSKLFIHSWWASGCYGKPGLIGYIYINTQSQCIIRYVAVRISLRNMSNSSSKRSKVLTRLETVEEVGSVMSDLPNSNTYNLDNDQLMRDSINISLQKDIRKRKLNPLSVEETDTTNVSTQAWREKLQKSLRSLRFHALVTVLVLLDVFLVLVDLILNGDIIHGECLKDDDCSVSQCSKDLIENCPCPINITISPSNSSNSICRLVGFKRECVSIEDTSVPVILILNGISLFILFIFILEIVLKLVAFRLRFFKKFFEVFDAVIVITSFIMEFVKYVFSLEQHLSHSNNNADSIEKLQFFDLLIAFRLWRVVRIITGALASYNTAKTQRHKTEVHKIVLTENKRYTELFNEYEYASDEILRLRKLLINMKANPFPAGYQLTLFEVQDLGIESIYTPSHKETLHIASLGNDNDVITFQFNPIWAEEADLSYYSDPSTKQLNRDKCNYLVSKITTVLSGLCITGPSLLYSVSRVSGELLRLVLSEVKGEEGEVRKTFQIEGRYPGHIITGARLDSIDNSCTCVSPTHELVASVYRDGRVKLRRVLEPAAVCLEFNVVHYSRDNILAVVFSDTAQSLYCLSKCGGGVSCVKLDGSGSMIGRQRTQAANVNKKMRDNLLRTTRENEGSYLQAQHGIGEISYKNDSGLKAKYITIKELGLNTESDTWLDVCNRDSEEKEKVIYTLQREELVNGLNGLRETVLQMIEDNQILPEIEQLSRTDFVLDIDKQRELKQKQEDSIKAKEREIHLQNLAKLFLTEQLKDTCWETMTVTGKNVYSFNRKVEVSNYPLSKLIEKERKARQAAIERIEIVKECIDAREDLDGDIGPGIYKTQISRIGQKTEDEDDVDDKGAMGGNKEEDIDRESIEGRKAETHGGIVIPSQFNTRSILSCRDLVLILHQSVFKVKQFFNQEFDEVLKLKQSEVMRTNERCFRIRQILQDLKTKHKIEFYTKSETLAMHAFEEPGRLLEVIDSEVKIDKYETVTERQQRTQLAHIEEERRLAEMGDKWRERGLDMMMGGKLEIDTEDELFRDLVEPEFLDNPALSADPELQARKQEWQLHVEQVKEERDKHKRALEAEMSKLEQAMVDGCQRVDDKIQQLYRAKISADKVVYQEELKIITLLAAEMFTQELLKQEEFLLKMLEQSREYKLVANERVNEIKEDLDNFTEMYASSQIDDKNLDRNFRKEHSDLEPHVDALYRLFRKRPRVQKRPVAGGTSGDVTLSIFPVASLSNAQVLRETTEELDAYTNAPEGVDLEGWGRLVAARKQKINSEQKLKKQALELAEIQAYHQDMVKQDEHAQSETDTTNIELDRLRGVKNRLYFNIQVQLLVKQGQVEVEDGGCFLTDHSDSILIFKQTIDELNKQVKLLGKEKLERMRQNMEFKRGIHLLEWEHRKLRMQAEDLQKKAKEIQTLKLTKDVQIRMQASQSLGRSNKADMELLEQELEYKKNAHDSKISSLDLQLSQLNKEISKRRDDNESLEGDMQEAAVAEAERSRLVERERPDPQELSNKRVRGVMLRRRMLDMVKAQAREISALQSELERLRLKTFPALLQLS